MSSSPEETNAGPVIRDLRRIDPRTGQVRTPGADVQGTAARGSGKPARPGRHSAAKPGGTPAAEAAAPAAPPAPPEAAGTGAGPATGGAPPAAAGPGGAPESGLAAQLAERTADLQRVSAEYANYRKRVDRDRLVVREQALANVLVALLPVLDDIGLVSFGTEGEPFDPNVHEALTHSYSAAVTEPTCVQILQPGYKVGERIVRPARVAVAEPADEVATAGEPDEASPSGGQDEAGSQESREDED